MSSEETECRQKCGCYPKMFNTFCPEYKSIFEVSAQDKKSIIVFLDQEMYIDII